MAVIVSGAMHILPGDLDDPQVVDLLPIHLTRARAETGRGSAHALDLDGPRASDIRFFAAWDDDLPLGAAALRLHSAELGEVKSMHTAEAAQRRCAGTDGTCVNSPRVEWKPAGLLYASLRT
ncbi:MAG: GNAT family N-acetyltransferase [Phycisphaerae bacterium]